VPQKNNFMKISKLSVLIFITISIYLAGCNKQSSYDSPNFNQPHEVAMSDDEIIINYSKMGEFHYNGLNYIYEYLKSINNNKTRNLTASELDLTLTQLNQKTYQYIQDSFLVTGLDYIPLYHYDTMTKPNIPIDNILQSQLSFTSSNTLKAAFDEFTVLLLDTTKNDEYVKYDSMIEKYIPLLPTEVEKKAFVSAVSVGKNSVKYWDENYSKWEILINNLSGRGVYAGKAISGPGKDILYADAVGAGTGAVRGAIVGASGGTIILPGIGTVSGGAVCGLVGMLGGGIVGSASEAAHSLIKKWLNW
jgi:hypothetical protein